MAKDWKGCTESNLRFLVGDASDSGMCSNNLALVSVLVMPCFLVNGDEAPLCAIGDPRNAGRAN